MRVKCTQEALTCEMDRQKSFIAMEQPLAEVCNLEPEIWKASCKQDSGLLPAENHHQG
jgi:hypothetical protein